MDNKKYLAGLSILAVFFLIMTVVFYLQKNSLLSSIDRLHEDSQTVRTLDELQQKVNAFFVASNRSTVSFLRSKASGTSAIAITGIKEKQVSIGSKITITGLGLNLPAFVIIDSGVITTPVTSENPDEISFTMPASVLTATCPPFPDAICSLGTTDRSTAGNQTPLSPGSHTIHVVSSSGIVSNSLSITIQ